MLALSSKLLRLTVEIYHILYLLRACKGNKSPPVLNVIGAGVASGEGEVICAFLCVVSTCNSATPSGYRSYIQGG